jgi:hypothetical protein
LLPPKVSKIAEPFGVRKPCYSLALILFVLFICSAQANKNLIHFRLLISFEQLNFAACEWAPEAFN